MTEFDLKTYASFLFAMAGVTFLLRAIPFVLLKSKIRNRFIQSVLAYIPYTVLAAMTVPAIFFSTNSVVSGVLALLTSVVASLWGGGLVRVALVACFTVLACEGILTIF
ncbi:MAG: AzlD domain-containing protein [Fibrobacter sp.]|nr:AzlD domain-containing protein [Fibrobacter sp.]